MRKRSHYKLWELGKFMEQKVWDEEEIGLAIVYQSAILFQRC